jgi:hypothetical protein
MVNCAYKMSADSEQIPYESVDGQEPLGLSGRLEALHLPLPPPRRLV